LTEPECEYFAQILRKEIESDTKNSSIKDQEAIFEKSKVTIEVLVANMVNPETVNNTFFSHYRVFSRENLLKLLLRAK
jgi:hypothetical protein